MQATLRPALVSGTTTRTKSNTVGVSRRSDRSIWSTYGPQFMHPSQNSLSLLMTMWARSYAFKFQVLRKHFKHISAKTTPPIKLTFYFAKSLNFLKLFDFVLFFSKMFCYPTKSPIQSVLLCPSIVNTDLDFCRNRFAREPILFYLSCNNLGYAYPWQPKIIIPKLYLECAAIYFSPACINIFARHIKISHLNLHPLLQSRHSRR